MQKITPFLWYAKEAEEAARFYAATFPNSRVTRVTAMQSESPSGPPGSVKIVELELFGQQFTAMTAGPRDPFGVTQQCIDVQRRRVGMMRQDRHAPHDGMRTEVGKFIAQPANQLQQRVGLRGNARTRLPHMRHRPVLRSLARLPPA